MADTHSTDQAGGQIQNSDSTSTMPADEPTSNVTPAPSIEPPLKSPSTFLSDAPATQNQENSDNVNNFGAIVRDQNDLEQAVAREADEALLKQADERDQKRLERAENDITKHERDIESARSRLAANPQLAQRLNTDIAVLEGKIKSAKKDCEQIKNRVEKRHQNAQAAATNADMASGQRRPGESKRDFLIRTGKITPFSNIAQAKRTHESLADVMADADEDIESSSEPEESTAATAPESRSHRELLQPGFADTIQSDAEMTGTGTDTTTVAVPAQNHVTKRRRIVRGGQAQTPLEPDADYDQTLELPSDYESEEDDGPGYIAAGTDGQRPRGLKRSRGKKPASARDDVKESLADVDDGNEAVYKARVKKWTSDRKAARARAQSKGDAPQQITGNEQALQDLPEYMRPHPTQPDEVFEGGLHVPGDIYPALFGYQKTGVRWLWELYQQKAGGIIGDEMGLGKTIQTISFIAALHHSGKLKKPVIVVCPATLLKQWSKEFHRWWPALRVSILHASGSGMLNIKQESRFDDDLDNLDENVNLSISDEDRPTKAKAHRIVDRVVKYGHVLITTYAGLQTYSKEILGVNWGYAILDEGHKIRNPNSTMTIDCKKLRTHNRLILSGTPMQNNLIELWSLFDFVYPMRLGTLVSFRDTFEAPIKLGGWAKASNTQVETARRCAEALKDNIGPYLLQRWKSDVASDLPSKTERVLFCRLTPSQVGAYQNYLGSDKHKAVDSGKMSALFSIDALRKICNHPDLLNHDSLDKTADYGAEHKSGKMKTVKSLMAHFIKEGHKVLLFSQYVITLDILENMVKGMDGVNYLRMDGKTAIKNRQAMVDDFNSDSELNVFLMTTKVGGLGLNLTGADRVIIFDPDWNPSTDAQARERAWRLGQKRDVEIYRLMTAGTIEEKVYHRQLYKTFLTNKVLRDPNQRQSFNSQGLSDLFNLGDMDQEQTETGGMFQGSETRLSPRRSGSAEEVVSEQERENTNNEQLASIQGLVRAEDFKDPTEKAKRSHTPEEAAAAAKNHFMESLLGESGVTSSFNHDNIIGQAAHKQGFVFADPGRVAREAKKVADLAAEQLRAAEQVARATPAGVPTWTGEVGVAGRPQPQGRARGGPASGAVLSNLSARGGGGAQQQQQQQPGPTGAALTPYRGIDWITRIRDFMLRHGGRVVSRMLLDHFQRYCTTPQRRVNFREMLRRIAEVDPSCDAGGDPLPAPRPGQGRLDDRTVWVLKEDYGGPGLGR